MLIRGYSGSLHLLPTLNGQHETALRIHATQNIHLQTRASAGPTELRRTTRKALLNNRSLERTETPTCVRKTQTHKKCYDMCR